MIFTELNNLSQDTACQNDSCDTKKKFIPESLTELSFDIRRINICTFEFLNIFHSNTQ